MGEYSYDTPSTPAISVALPIVTETEINTLVSVIVREILDFTNSDMINCFVTITNYNIDGTIFSNEIVPLSKNIINSQISDLEYKLLLYSNAATTKEELLLVTNTKTLITSWKTIITATVTTTTDPVISLAKDDPDYLVIMYYRDYITSYTRISSSVQWADVYGYVNKINPILEKLKLLYPNDVNLSEFKTTLDNAITSLTACWGMYPS